MRRGKTFQLTHSRGVRRKAEISFSRMVEFQLTHSRGVRRDSYLRCIDAKKISTHALTWSATVDVFAGIQTTDRISTHALTWSATFVDITEFMRYNQFQLTHSRGVRPENTQEKPKLTDFNSRTHVECDALTASCISGKKRFQLTHSRGVRLMFLPAFKQPTEFQLTHSRGVRPLKRIFL